MVSLGFANGEESMVLGRKGPDKKLVVNPQQSSLIDFVYPKTDYSGKVQVNYWGPLTLLKNQTVLKYHPEGVTDDIYDAHSDTEGEKFEEMIEGGLPIVLCPRKDRFENPVTNLNMVSLLSLGREPGILGDLFGMYYVGDLLVYSYKEVLESKKDELIRNVRTLTRDLTRELRKRETGREQGVRNRRRAA